MLEFSKYAQDQTLIAPVRQGRFFYRRKEYIFANGPESHDQINGWFEIVVNGNDIISSSPLGFVSPEMVEDASRITTGYGYYNRFIFKNASEAINKFGQQDAMEFKVVEFLNQTDDRMLAVSVYVCPYSDRIFFIAPNYSDLEITSANIALTELKENLSKAAQETKDLPEIDLLSVKGLSPQIRAVIALDLMSYQEQLLQIIIAAQEAELEELKRSKPAYIGRMIQNAGGRVIEVRNYAEGYLEIIWQLTEASYRFRSRIEEDSLRVVNAGYCMSNHDSEHTLTSMIMLAREYHKNRQIHITAT